MDFSKGQKTKYLLFNSCQEIIRGGMVFGAAVWKLTLLSAALFIISPFFSWNIVLVLAMFSFLFILLSFSSNFIRRF